MFRPSELREKELGFKRTLKKKKKSPQGGTGEGSNLFLGFLKKNKNKPSVAVGENGGCEILLIPLKTLFFFLMFS